MPRRTMFALILAPCALTLSVPAQADEGDWATASDVVRAALVGAAIGVPVVEGDDDGAVQAGLSMGAAFLVTEGLKQTFPSMRPDGSDNRSFPSNHTALSFAAAATLHERQGDEVGIAAHVAAAFVGVARVEARKHRWGDVIVGAAIGELSGRLLTRRPQDHVAIVPWADLSGGGVTVAMRF